MRSQARWPFWLQSLCDTEQRRDMTDWLTEPCSSPLQAHLFWALFSPLRPPPPPQLQPATPLPSRLPDIPPPNSRHPLPHPLLPDIPHPLSSFPTPSTTLTLLPDIPHPPPPFRHPPPSPSFPTSTTLTLLPDIHHPSPPFRLPLQHSSMIHTVLQPQISLAGLPSSLLNWFRLLWSEALSSRPRLALPRRGRQSAGERERERGGEGERGREGGRERGRERDRDRERESLWQTARRGDYVICLLCGVNVISMDWPRNLAALTHRLSLNWSWKNVGSVGNCTTSSPQHDTRGRA